MFTLTQLRNIDADRFDLDELVSLSAFGRSLQAEYATLNAEEPEWLGTRLRELRREIRTRLQDRIEKTLREHRARLESLKPAEQKRTELEAEIKKLEEQLKAVP